MSVLTGLCPDKACGKRLYFPSDITTKVDCTGCGQRHESNQILNISPVTNPTAAIQSLLQSIIVKSIPEQHRKTNESVKVQGLSNYGCKLLSPLLTKYGLNKKTGEIKMLKTMGQGEIFDCKNLSDRAFRIEEQKLEISGYGRDFPANNYLADTLKEVEKINNNQGHLVAIHADGDGHCLLHAVSRALVGHELFWHPLMTNLKAHLINRKEDYKLLLKDFFEETDWDNIIREADPNFIPSNGETHGLCNIHIFGLANVLHRTIILLDSLEGMQSKGDYSAVFIPALVPLQECRDKANRLHKPIIVAWSSKGRNHFVPLVGIKEKPLPQFPKYLLPKLWGLPQDLLSKYVDFDNDSCMIGGEKTLSEQYLTQLVSAMEKHFTILNGIAPSVVQDVYQHIISPNDTMGATTQMVIEASKDLSRNERLFKCLLCKAVVELAELCPQAWLEPGGKLYEIAKQTHGTMKDGFCYRFPQHDNILCSYNQEKNRLLFVQDISAVKCKHCQGSLRMVKYDGCIVYANGDQLSTPASHSSKCGCGFKHFWEGKEYDNLPLKIPITMEWCGETVADHVIWFQDEVDKSLNSNAYERAQKMVQKHFPGEFGSERIVQKVVDQIFLVTLKDKPEPKKLPCEALPTTPTKIILTGAKSKTIHKEELTASKSEKIIRKKIEHGAVMKQKRLSSSPIKNSLQNTQPVQKELKSKFDQESRSSKPSSNERKIRISVANSRSNEVFILSDGTTFENLQTFIFEKFNISKEQQIIKYGFPPKTFDETNGDIPLSLKHGERLTVHIKKQPDRLYPTLSKESATETTVKSTAVMEVDYETSITENQENVEDTTSAAANVLDTFATQLNTLFQHVDLWELASSQPSMFKPGGLFYRQVCEDLGTLVDHQHFSVPCFPKKLFSYNANDDQILLCLGDSHIPVQPLTAQQLIIANQQNYLQKHQQSHSQQQLSVTNPQEASATSFTVLNRKPSLDISAFSGVGHSMVIEKKQEMLANSNCKTEITERTLVNTVKSVSPKSDNHSSAGATEITTMEITNSSKEANEGLLTDHLSEMDYEPHVGITNVSVGSQVQLPDKMDTESTPANQMDKNI